MSKSVIPLTPEQIKELSNVLHEHIQFYDSQGRESNDIVLNKCEEVLTEHFCTEPHKP